MTNLRVYERAEVRFSDEDAAAIALILTKVDDDGKLIESPPSFPLQRAKVVFNGANATISVPETNRRHRRVTRLVDAKITDPRRDTDPIVIEGTSEELSALGFDAEQSRIQAVIASYSHCATCQ